MYLHIICFAQKLCQGNFKEVSLVSAWCPDMHIVLLTSFQIQVEICKLENGLCAPQLPDIISMLVDFSKGLSFIHMLFDIV
jgi:hypothetical protein